MSRNKTANKGNCITKERDTVKEATIKCVKAHNIYMAGHQFEKIPIFKGYRLQEVKPK